LNGIRTYIQQERINALKSLTIFEGLSKIGGFELLKEGTLMKMMWNQRRENGDCAWVD